MNDKTKYYDNYFFFPLLLGGATSASWILPAIIFFNFRYALLSLMFVFGLPSLYKQLNKDKKDRLTFIAVILANFIFVLIYEYSGLEFILIAFVTPIIWVGVIYWKFVNEE